ncbi:arf-GAP domain and FG repeat-containing protein 2 isoform X1 [Peromyscus leucopus]|uniref:arf-GAP domain and FG repeat-containing protein 2 isoform X1 n=1 Tax=Peromyscus leucopus TaxID=10041 RepID=UPI0010A0E870|nr:arf-GAP domain and FG repeat-containing protein 2 isoform X1 [Peromyscus leucopus]
MVMAAKKGPGPGGGVGGSKAEAEAASEVWCRRVRELGGCSQAGNRHCFECAQRGVTYVDITVGSFVCTTCSGLLRGLNPPHRVKSISMTTFTEPEVLFLQSRGNEVCRKIWLGLFDARTSLIPDSRDPQKVKEFLQEKYEKKRWYVPQSKSKDPLIAKAVPLPPPRALSRKGSPCGHFWETLCPLMLLPLRASPRLVQPRPGPPSLLPTHPPRKPALTCWRISAETPLPLPRWPQPLPRSQPLEARLLPTEASPTSTPSVAALALPPSEASLHRSKPRSRPSRPLQGAARCPHSVWLPSRLPLSPAASQTWVASWDPGWQLEVSLAVFSGCPARFLHYSRLCQVSAAMPGSPLEPSPTPSPPLPSPSWLRPTHSRPMAWPRGPASG